jgi:hypothetical protein
MLEVLWSAPVSVRGRWELNDEQWEMLEPVLHEPRAVLNEVLSVQGTGRSGANCRRSIRRPGPVLAASSPGNGVASTSRCWRAGSERSVRE